MPQVQGAFAEKRCHADRVQVPDAPGKQSERGPEGSGEAHGSGAVTVRRIELFLRFTLDPLVLELHPHLKNKTKKLWRESGRDGSRSPLCLREWERLQQIPWQFPLPNGQKRPDTLSA